MSFKPGFPLPCGPKPKVGAPKTIATYSDKPTEEQCAEAYDSIELSDMEKTTENLAENLAGWFK